MLKSAALKLIIYWKIVLFNNNKYNDLEKHLIDDFLKVDLVMFIPPRTEFQSKAMVHAFAQKYKQFQPFFKQGNSLLSFSLFAKHYLLLTLNEDVITSDLPQIRKERLLEIKKIAFLHNYLLTMNGGKWNNWMFIRLTFASNLTAFYRDRLEKDLGLNNYFSSFKGFCSYKESKSPHKRFSQKLEYSKRKLRQRKSKFPLSQ